MGLYTAWEAVVLPLNYARKLSKIKDLAFGPSFLALFWLRPANRAIYIKGPKRRKERHLGQELAPVLCEAGAGEVWRPVKIRRAFKTTRRQGLFG